MDHINNVLHVMTHELMQHQVDFYLHTNLSQRDWVVEKTKQVKMSKRRERIPLPGQKLIN